MPELQSCCSDCLLPVTRLPEWQGLEAGPDYRVDFHMLGRHIIVTTVHGDFRHADPETLFAHRDRVLRAVHGATRLPFVEIRDYGDSRGYPNRQARLGQRDMLLTRNTGALGWLVIRSPSLIRQLFRVGMLIHPPPIPIEFFPTLGPALRRALALLEAAGTDTLAESCGCITSQPILRQLQLPSVSMELRCAGPHLFYGCYRGELHADHLPAVRQCYEEALREAQAKHGLESGVFTKISDYNGAVGGWRIRSQVASALRAAHAASGVTPARTIMIGASPAMQLTAKLAAPLLNYDLLIAPDLRSAITLIRARQLHDDPPEQARAQQSFAAHHVQDVLSFIAGMAFDDHEPSAGTLDADHPLASVIAALELLHRDLRSMVAESDTARATIERQNSELRAEVARRTASERELRSAMAALGAANQAKGRFLANMGHEVRTPLTGILGAAELLAKTAPQPEQKRLIELIIRSGNGLRGLLDDLLDFSKIDVGRLQLNPQAVVLSRLFEEVTGIFVHRLLDGPVALAHELADDLPPAVLVDGQRLRQILINLVANAVAFTRQGRIDLRCQRGPGTQPTLVITVRDTGIGIPATEHHRIFEAFSQVDDSDRRDHGGAGLGLAICSQLLRLMQGSIAVDSSPGRGSTFTVTLPLVPAPLPESDSGIAAPRLPAGLRVLVVEDHPINQQVTARLLEHAGCRVWVAADGAQALEQLQSQTIDAVLMDVQMPHMDGLECTRRIRAQYAKDQLPILGLSASVDAADRNACLAAGMNGHIGKPIRSAELLARLAELIGPVGRG